MISRTDAFALLKEYNKDSFHIQHALTVEAVMQWYAKELGYAEDAEYWGIVGLLHDIDFEEYPEEHCLRAPELLKKASVSDDIIHAVCSHGYGITVDCGVTIDVKPEHEMEKVLFAADELTGLIGAAALMRPSKSTKDMELKSLKKKYKSKGFAAGCSREVIERGAQQLGWDLDKLLLMTLQAMADTEDAIAAEMEKEKNGIDITELGNPAKPQGEYGKQMLQSMNEHHAPVTEWGLSFFDIAEDADLLDIGCGGGATLRRLAELSPKGTIYGIDYSDVSVEESISFNRALVDAGKMKILSGSVASMPFPDSVFDGITTVESFYFWPEPEQNLKEVRRVLKEGGVFLLIADIYGGYDFDEHTKDNIRKYDLFNPSPEEFEKMFVNAGFSTVIVHRKEDTSWICVEGRK